MLEEARSAGAVPRVREQEPGPGQGGLTVSMSRRARPPPNKCAWRNGPCAQRHKAAGLPPLGLGSDVASAAAFVSSGR